MSKAIAILFTIFTTCNLCALEDLVDPDIDMHLLKECWKIPTGGSRNDSYNRIMVNGELFDGERDWDVRWNFIKDAYPFEGKRILELGCNISLVSVYLSKFRNIASATTVEFQKHIERARDLFQRAFHINSIRNLHVDLNKHPNYEDALGYDYDVVFCLSVIRFLKDRNKMMTYLSKFDNVIYETISVPEPDIAMFAEYGFTNYTILGESHIGYSYRPHQKRSVIHFWK